MALYSADFLARTATCSGEARAVLLLMLVVSWEVGPLPADPRKLARALNIRPRLLAIVWPEIELEWVTSEGFQRCPWLEQERQRVREISAERARAGHLGGIASASANPQQIGGNRQAIASNLLKQNGSQLSSSSSSRSTNSTVGPRSGAPSAGPIGPFTTDSRAEALEIAERERPECPSEAIVEKFASWVALHPTSNWRAALATFARRERFSESGHAEVKRRRAAGGPVRLRDVLGGRQ